MFYGESAKARLAFEWTQISQYKVVNWVNK